MANLYLVPGSAFVMVGAYVNYHAEQIKSNKAHIIKLPTHQYHLAIGNPDLASGSPDEALVTGIALGSTEVILRDSNLASDIDTRLPRADLYIVQPNYITINVNPHKNWNVVVGKRYEIVVDIWDSENNHIYPSDNVVVKVEVESGFFDIESRSTNGTFVVGQPIKVGTAQVQATLIGLKSSGGQLIEFSPHLKATGELEIFDPILLTPQLSGKV